MAVARVAVLTAAVYEWNAHAPLALRGGIQAAELQAVRTVPDTSSGGEREIRRRLVVGRDVPPLDPGPLLYPFVRRIHRLFEIVIGHDVCGQVTTGAGDT